MGHSLQGMKRWPLAMMIAITVLSLSGCRGIEAEPIAEEVLQLENDILEDPLLTEMDALEESLLIESEESLVATATEALEPTTAPATVKTPAKVQNSPSALPAEPATSTTQAPLPTERPAAVTVIAKKIQYGIVKKVNDVGLSLRVIKLKNLTPEEQRRLENGEKIPRFLLTDEVLRLTFSDALMVEKMDRLNPVPATAAEITQGQTVRITLDKTGNISLVRILKN